MLGTIYTPIFGGSQEEPGMGWWEETLNQEGVPGQTHRLPRGKGKS